MDHLVWIIAAIGIVSLIGGFIRMKPGFGPFNLRALGIVLIAALASLLSLKDGASLTACFGIFGAIVGYLFGLKDSTT
ncbi:MAG TPA: hypothetical protein VKC61_07340 [Pyrinomonadaceae bacterium]|nr:hypothetical protein [Pyrinomonadaceae bacterium]